MRQGRPNGDLGCRAVALRQPYILGIDLVGDIDDDIAAIAFGPAFLPEVAGHLGNLVDALFQFGVVV